MNDKERELAGSLNQARIYQLTKLICDCGHKHPHGERYKNNPCAKCTCKVFHRNVVEDNWTPKHDG